MKILVLCGAMPGESQLWCGWSGYRKGDRASVQQKPCPKCGGHVTAFLRGDQVEQERLTSI